MHRFSRHLVLVLLLPSVLFARDVYVSKSGSDLNVGTKEEPLATIEKAVETMRGAGGGTVWIDDGEYYLPQGILLDSEHSGTAKKPLVIRGVRPGQTRLSGARVVSGFRPISAEEAKPLVSPTAAKHVLVADLADGAICGLFLEDR